MEKTHGERATTKVGGCGIMATKIKRWRAVAVSITANQLRELAKNAAKTDKNGGMSQQYIIAEGTTNNLSVMGYRIYSHFHGAEGADGVARQSVRSMDAHRAREAKEGGA